MPFQTLLIAKYSDLLGGESRSATNYFTQIRRCAGLIPINIFATANNLLSVDQGVPDVHKSLEESTLSDSIRNKLRRERKQRKGEPPTIAFTRSGAQLNLKLLLAVPRPNSTYRATAVGACALHANDFIESPNTEQLRNGLLPVITEFAASWEAHNQRDVGPLLRRSYNIYHRLQDHAGIRTLIAAELGSAVKDVRFAGLPFRSYFPLLFGFYATARQSVARDATSIVDGFDIARKACVPHEDFTAFILSKARTLDEARMEFGQIDTEQDFRRRVEDSAWTSDMLPFRKKPLLVLPDGRHLVLDMACLIENASAGIFWNFMEQLASANARHRFSTYYGNVFESYVQELVMHYLPSMMRNLSFSGGGIDIFLDDDSIAIPIEVKSGFVPQKVKGARDQALLGAELEKKYVVDQDGHPKGVRQLAAAVRALREQRVAGIAKKYGRIYPVLVAEDPIMQTVGMNAYLNQLFEHEIDRGSDVAPLTILQIDELEQVLPHLRAGDLSFGELLDTRFVGESVVAQPMHTTFSEIASERNLSIRQDTFLESHGDELVQMITSAYASLLNE
jgi:hypothetical protein